MTPDRRSGVAGHVLSFMVVLSAAGALAGTYTIDVQDFSFEPNNVALAPGDTVHFVWINGMHTATSGTPCTPDNLYFDHAVDMNNLTFDFQIPTGVTQIPYFCRFHCAAFNMSGILRIYPLGDLNCDGAVNFADINPFVMALSNPSGYEQAHPTCNINLADINGDGHVDFADINPFVALLTQPDGG